MKPSAYLDAVKAELNIESDYALGNAIELNPKTIPEIRRGERAIPLDVAFRIAITLNLDPAMVVADLAEQREKNEKRRGFWRSFLSRAVCMIAAICCTLAFQLSAMSASAPALLGGKKRSPKLA